MLAHDEVARILGECQDPVTAADEVVAAALAVGSRDDATAVVVDVVGLTSQLPPDTGERQTSSRQETGAHP